FDESEKVWRRALSLVDPKGQWARVRALTALSINRSALRGLRAAGERGEEGRAIAGGAGRPRGAAGARGGAARRLGGGGRGAGARGGAGGGGDDHQRARRRLYLRQPAPVEPAPALAEPHAERVVAAGIEDDDREPRSALELFEQRVESDGFEPQVASAADISG